jgi:tetratricopeptide (TPR) repeat protein
VGPLHKDALLNAMTAFEKARPKDTAGRTKLYPVDKKFGEAIDIYANLFKNDPTIVGVLFKNGQMFFDYGEYDEAIKRFGLIVTQYPKDPNAGAAGDKILSALNKAKDYGNLEEWARKLKTAPSFASKEKQELLSRLIVESIMKNGDTFAEAGKHEEAAKIFLRAPKETTDAKLAATALMNAGNQYEKARLPEKAAEVYMDVAEKYSQQAELAEKAAFTAGVVYEKAIYFDRAATSYELVWKKFGKRANNPASKASDALFNAGLLRQGLGQNKEAIAHYKEYASKFPNNKDAADVGFNIGVVYENVGEDGPAYKAYVDYAKNTRLNDGKRVIEAWTRAGRMSFKLGQYKRAKEELAVAIARWKNTNDKAEKAAGTTWAAEARYYEGELVFRDYEKVSLDVKPKDLTKALERKSKLLADAEKLYVSIADFKDPKWATAALFRYGQIYDSFAEALVKAAETPPPNVPKDLHEAYADKLNEVVVGIQDKAVEAFTFAYKKAIELQVYDENTAKIRTALGRLASQKYPPERESRGKERIGDRPPTPELVTEIVR